MTQPVSSEEEQTPQTGDGLEQQTSQAEVEQELILRVPDTAILPPDSTFYEGEDDKVCRLIKQDGTRCRSTRMRATGLCAGHSGVGGVAKDPHGNAALANASKRRRSEARLSLGISARRAAQPLQAARVAAQANAEAYATAIVTAPLEDESLSTVARQQAAIRALELLYPQVTASMEVSMPDEAEGVAQMGWQEMQALAARLTEEA